jgi:hypothetical protein
MELVATRQSLHAVAELVLAGPQYRTSQTIRLRVVPGGLATVREPEVRIDGAEVVAGPARVPIDGASCRAIAEALGLAACDLSDVYTDVTGVSPDQVLAVDGAAAARLTAAFVAGDVALATFAPDSARTLWPEHFDVSLSVDEVNYGVSPGDGYLAEPYAYVGPWVVPAGPFWNAPFGATLPLGADPDSAAIAEFFALGRAHVQH